MSSFLRSAGDAYELAFLRLAGDVYEFAYFPRNHLRRSLRFTGEMHEQGSEKTSSEKATEACVSDFSRKTHPYSGKTLEGFLEDLEG